MSDCKRISIINFKGGVGKTVISLNLAAGLERFHNARVLLVDTDHQSSLSWTVLGEDEWHRVNREQRTVDRIFKSFTDGTPIPDTDVIYNEPYENYPMLDILPSSSLWDETELDITAMTKTNPILSEWIKRTVLCYWIDNSQINDIYDYIIFDCPPSTKVGTQNAIAASHGYIVPTIPDGLSVWGIPYLTGRIKDIDQQLSGLAGHLHKRDEFESFVSSTELLGVVINRVMTAAGTYTIDHRKHLRDYLEKSYGRYLIKPYIPQRTGISGALSQGQPVYDVSYNIKNIQLDEKFKLLTKNLKQRIDIVSGEKYVSKEILH